MWRRRRDSPTAAAASPPSPAPFILHPDRRVFSMPNGHCPPPPPPTTVLSPAPDLEKQPSLESTAMGISRPPASMSPHATPSSPPRSGQPANAPAPAAAAPAPASDNPGHLFDNPGHVVDVKSQVPESLPSSSHASVYSGSKVGHGSVKPKSRKRTKILSVSWGAKGKRGRGEKGLSLKFDIQQLPHDMGAMLFKKDIKCETENDVLVPKIEAKVFSPAPEDSVPSSFGSNLVVSLDDKAGEIGEISEHKTGMEKVVSCSLGGGMLSCDSGSCKEEALGDEIQFSRMDGCHENGGLGHQDSSGVELGCPNHLALELNACKSVVDIPRSVVFVENVKDEELENQKSESSNVSRRRNPRRSASAKNPTPEKHDQICKGSNSTCKSKKVKSPCSFVESNIIKHEHDSMKGPSIIGEQKTNALDNVKSPSRKKNGQSGGKGKMRDPFVKGKSMSKKIAGDIFYVSGLSTSDSQLVIDLAASQTNEQSTQ